MCVSSVRFLEELYGLVQTEYYLFIYLFDNLFRPLCSFLECPLIKFSFSLRFFLLFHFLVHLFFHLLHWIYTFFFPFECSLHQCSFFQQCLFFRNALLLSLWVYYHNFMSLIPSPSFYPFFSLLSFSAFVLVSALILHLSSTRLVITLIPFKTRALKIRWEPHFKPNLKGKFQTRENMCYISYRIMVGVYISKEHEQIHKKRWLFQ